MESRKGNKTRLWLSASRKRRKTFPEKQECSNMIPTPCASTTATNFCPRLVCATQPKMNLNKWCFIPGCTNTSKNNPEKLFISVPRNVSRKKKWFAAAGRKVQDVSPKTTFYCCEDHFDIKEDMENYLEHRLSKVAARMKPEIVPHIFTCPPNKKTSSEKNFRKRMASEVGMQSDFSCQVNTIRYCNKATQVSLQEIIDDLATSPIQFAVPVEISKRSNQKLMGFDSDSLQKETTKASSNLDFWHPTQGDMGPDQQLSIPNRLFTQNIKKEADDIDLINNVEFYLKQETMDVVQCESTIKQEITIEDIHNLEAILKQEQIIKTEDIDYLDDTLKQEAVDISDCKSPIAEPNDENYSCLVSTLDDGYQETKCDSSIFTTSTVEEHESDIQDSNKTAYSSVLKKQVKKAHLIKPVRKKSDKVTMYKCDECNHQTRQKSDLRKHQKKHINIEEIEHYDCESCSYRTKHKSDLRRHMNSHLSLDEVAHYQCESCDFRTASLWGFKTHILVHKSSNEVTMYRCDVCDFQTKHKMSMNRHKVTHLGFNEVKHYACETCGFKTKHKKSLKKHLKRHFNLDKVGNNYHCKICGYQTDDLCDYKNHFLLYRKSDDVTMYSCNECHYQSKTKGCLKQHQNKHLSLDEVELFICDTCGFQTKLKHSLRRHLKKHLSIDEVEHFNCETCDYQTRKKNYLKKHLETHV